MLMDSQRRRLKCPRPAVPGGHENGSVTTAVRLTRKLPPRRNVARTLRVAGASRDGLIPYSGGLAFEDFEGLVERLLQGCVAALVRVKEV